VATLAAAWDDVTNPNFITISGTEGFAAMGEELVFVGRDGQKTVITDLEPSALSGLDSFLRHLEGDVVELVTPQEAAARDTVMSAIYQGAETATWVSIA
jgi:predicted dehydrogenase